MAVFMRSRPHWTGSSSLFWKLLPLVPQPMCSIDCPSTCSEIKRSFRAHTLFSSREGAQGEIERNLCLLSEGQSTKEEKINAWLYDMRDSTIEKIRAGQIPLQYSNCMLNNHSRKGIAPAPRKVKHGTKYKVLKFGGRIVYCRTDSEVKNATMELLDKIKAKNSAGRVPLGFDLEWKPSFRKGVGPGKTAVMQICMDTACCYVMHVIHSGIPSILKSFLEDSSSVKVGIGIAGDATKLLKDYGVNMQSLMDLSDLGSAKLTGTRNIWNLSALMETVMCKQLSKRHSIRLGNWENTLSKKQLQYAATDAFACWHLYEVLNGMPDLEIEKESLAASAKFSNKKEKKNSLEQEKKNKRRERENRKREKEKGS
ncbi:Werner Syndrome-like exonuclease isoform X1 [Carex littledalei]|uniref:3'-5' exonuclease n=1 Tax=Carex littledalei TaxID=544730 RepID=A0A833RJF7_9POAL|nr:Werner Syndrome-like exonuclease isoform X1 [Carex littledalei]